MSGVSPAAVELHEQALVIDAHTHPSLKTYLLGKRLWKRHRAGGAWNPLCMRVDIPNAAAPPVDGIPRTMKGWGCFTAKKDLELGLTGFGEELVEAMLDLRMIIDLTHCNYPARRRVMDLVGVRSPLVFSHVGVRPLADFPISPKPQEMARIAASGGAVGVIFMNHWLGEEESEDGLEAIVRTVREIVMSAGIEHVALGSDFDGFTDPPDDLQDSSRMPHLTDALLRDGFSHDDVEKILGKNFHRVLGEGWR